VKTRNSDDWTIEHWRTEPRCRVLDPADPETVDQAPPLWKDLTVAFVIAAASWAAALVLFG
jgi:hypothetical protein